MWAAIIRGNRRTYTLARLKRDRPDLAERVMRGHKKTLRTDSCEGFSERDFAAEHARSTVGQVAKRADEARKTRT